MGSESKINALEYLDVNDFKHSNSTSSYIQLNVYYCSFARVGYINNTSEFRFHTMDELDSVHSFCKAKNITADIIIWFALVLGIPGNIVALATLLTMPQTPGTFYISLLSLTDLMALSTRACNLLFLRFDLSYTSELCRFMEFITNYSVTYSNWVLVFICLERFITIRFPLKKSFYFTLRRARYSALVLAIALLPIFLTFIFLTEAKDGVCIIYPSMEYFYREIFSHIVEVLYSFLPAGFLFLFTMLVIIELRKHKEIRKMFFEDRSPTRNGTEHHGLASRETTLSRKRRRESEALGRSITIMMTITAIIFLFLTIPSCIAYTIILRSKSGHVSTLTYAKNEFLWKTVVSINLLSHAINFYIYCLSARKFRKHLHSLLVKRKRKRQTKLSLLSKSTRIHHNIE